MSTAPAVTEEKFDVQKLTPPDTSALPKIDFPGMLLVRVIDDATLETAQANAIAARAYITSVQGIFDEPTTLAHRLHKWFTGMRSKLVGPAESVESHSKDEIQRYLQKKEQERLELERKLQREADEAQRKLEEEAKAVAAREAESLDVFDLLDRVDEPSAPPPPAPTVRVAQQSYAGVGTANKPWTYVVEDKKKFVEFVLANWDLLNGYLLLDEAGLKAQAKQWQAELGSKFPGLNGIRPQRVNLK